LAASEQQEATMSADKTPVLWHLEISNFNEKARWALDHKRVAHHRRTVMPAAHSLVALYRTRRVATFPVLELEGREIGDSTAIIAALERRFPGPPLYPADPDERRRALALEEFFDENLGHDLRRVVFFELLGDPELMRSFLAEMTTARQARFMGAALPAMRAILRRRYTINARSAAQSLLKVRAAMGLIEDVLDSGDYLVGERFTVADLTGAALLAPVIAPPEFPYRPNVPFPQRLQEIADELRALPAGEWVLRTYARHRPPTAEIGAQTQVAATDSNGAAPLPDQVGATHTVAG
jgi:glutathione S-transferase